MSRQQQITILVNPMYHKLVPRPTRDQYNALKQSIRENGLYDPIVLNKKHEVLDGHTRLDICNDLCIMPSYEIKQFSSVDEEYSFVIMTNLARRHLTTFRKAEIVYDWFVRERKKGNKNKHLHLHYHNIGKKYSHGEKLHKRFGRMVGIKPSTLHKCIWLIENITSKWVLGMLRSGSASITGTYYRNRGKKRKKIDYSRYVRVPYCLVCRGKTIRTYDTKCHVHKYVCCTKCKWGY